MAATLGPSQPSPHLNLAAVGLTPGYVFYTFNRQLALSDFCLMRFKIFHYSVVCFSVVEVLFTFLIVSGSKYILGWSLEISVIGCFAFMEFIF